MDLLARKPIAALHAECDTDGGTDAPPRSIGLFGLTCFGVGSTIGAGIFVLTGAVAAPHAGPAVALSFALASMVCLLAGLCYAELASMIPVAGSAYSYTYATLGEGVAWIVGWCLVLEYLFSCSIVAIGWSGYARAALHDHGLVLSPALTHAPFESVGAALVPTGSIVDLGAMLVVLLCTAVVLAGVELSAKFNSLVVTAKVAVILAVALVGFWHVDPARWTPFVPPNTGEFGVYGWSGVLRGTAILFFAYVGFDAVSTMGREVKAPKRTIPLALFLSLAICAVLYVLTSFAVTGLSDYRDLNVPDPIYVALDHGGPAMAWAKPLVAIVTVFGLLSVLLVTILGQARIFYAMGRDGLLPQLFARLDRGGAPYAATLVTGVVAALAAGFLPLGWLGEVISIGTLLAFAVVCVGVVVLRLTSPDAARPFRVPFSPWLPIAGALACCYMMWSLPADTWRRLALWLTLGAVVYAVYGRRFSRLRIARRAVR